MLDNICESSSILRLLFIFKNVLSLAFAIIPMIIVISSMYSFWKCISKGDPKEIKEAGIITLQRIVLGAFIIFLPTFLEFLFTPFIENTKRIHLCFENATMENINYYATLEPVAKIVEAANKYPTKFTIDDARKRVDGVSGILKDEQILKFYETLDEAEKKIVKEEPINPNKPITPSGNGLPTTGTVEGNPYSPNSIRGGTTTLTVDKKEYIVISTDIGVKKYSNTMKKKGVYQAIDEDKYGSQCLAFAYTHAYGIYSGNTTQGMTLDGNYHAGAFTSYINDNKQDVLSKIYNEVSNGRPVILQVNGNKQGTSRHFVTVVGFKSNVSSASSLKEEDLLIMDSWSAEIKTMDKSTSRFMTTGKQTRRDYNGYRILYLK